VLTLFLDLTVSAFLPWPAPRILRCGVQNRMSPHFWDQRGTGGYTGAVRWKWSLLLYSRQSLFSTVQVTEFQLPYSRHPAKLMISEKTAWVVFPQFTPLDCCIIQIYMPNRTGRYTKYGILLLMLSLTMIHNTIGLGLPMFINATSCIMRQPVCRQQIPIYSAGPCWYLLACTPHLEKWGVQKKFLRSLLSRILFCTPHLKIRDAAPDATLILTHLSYCQVYIWPSPR